MATPGVDYSTLIQAILNYYNGDDLWIAVANQGIDASQALDILKQTQGVTTIIAEDGTEVLSYAINSPVTSTAISKAEQIGTALNSNTQLSTTINSANVNIPANMGVSEAGTLTAQSGSILSSAGTVVKTVGTVAANAVTGAAVAATLGKTIDSILYNANPDFWDSHNMSMLDPQKWGQITAGLDTTSAKAFNMLFGIKDDGSGQSYISEDALAYIALYMQSQGAFMNGEIATQENPSYSLAQYTPNPAKCSRNRVSVAFDDGTIREAYGVGTAPVYTACNLDNRPGGYSFISVSTEPFTMYSTEYPSGQSSYQVTRGGITYYECSHGGSYIGSSPHIAVESGVNKIPTEFNLTKILQDTGYVIMSGVKKNDGVEGINPQDGAIIPELIGVTTVEEAKEKLKEQYPGLWDNAITNDIIQPDGTISTITSVPVTTPDTDAEGNPITGSSTQTNPEVNPESSPESLQQSASDNFSTPPSDPGIGTGITPPPILPTGSASSLWAIYNPTQGQLNQFGAWLWSDSFIDQIKKLFNDPMQAIIGVHKIFVTPPTGGNATIVCGYLDSGVPSRTVSSQYTTVSCGSVSLREYFGNVFDYNPYTEVSIYLPFIGIQRLDVDDVMRATISVEYTVDVLTGACQAKVNVMRDSAGGTIYCYSGNCSVTYPISSGSYMGVVSAIASVAGTLVSAVATGGATAPLAVGAVSGLMHAKTNVQHSGSLSGNAGACGIKKPYLIISRPQTAMPAAYEAIEGTSTNYTVKLGTCSGYTRVKEMHVEGVNCTASELADIERLLKEGVIL